MYSANTHAHAGVNFSLPTKPDSTREEKLASFLPVLHLSNANQLYLTQLKQFDEVYMRLEQF